MDSAPELWLTSPVAGDAVERPAGGRVVHRLAGGVGAEVPRRHDPGEAVRGLVVPVGVGRGEQRLQPRVGAVGDLRGVAAGGQPAVVRATRREQPRVEGERVARGTLGQAGVVEGHGGLGQRGRASARPSRATSSGTGPRAGSLPSASCRAVPPPSSAMPSLSCARVRRALAEPPASTYAASPSTASAVASPPSAISQAGAGCAVDVEVVAVPVEDLTVDRADRELEPVAEEARERGVGRSRRPRSPHRAPRSCGPASRTRRCRTGRAARRVRRWG